MQKREKQQSMISFDIKSMDEDNLHLKAGKQKAKINT
jgi:hypothetical protein